MSGTYKIISLAFILCSTIFNFSLCPSQNEQAEDTFVCEFVKDKNNPKVTYDGKMIVLYASSDQVMPRVLVFTFILCIYEWVCLIANANDRSGEIEFCARLAFVLYVLAIAACYGSNLMHSFLDTPVMKIDNDGIECWDGRSIKWGIIKKIKLRDMVRRSGDFLRAYRVIDLCDKYLNSLFSIDDTGEYLPISVGNLYVLLKYYLQKQNSNTECV